MENQVSNDHVGNKGVFTVIVNPSGVEQGSEGAADSAPDMAELFTSLGRDRPVHFGSKDELEDTLRVRCIYAALAVYLTALSKTSSGEDSEPQLAGRTDGAHPIRILKQMFDAQRVIGGLANLTFTEKGETQSYKKQAFNKFVNACLGSLGYNLTRTKSTFTDACTLEMLCNIGKESGFVWEKEGGYEVNTKYSVTYQECVIYFKPQHSLASLKRNLETELQRVIAKQNGSLPTTI